MKFYKNKTLALSIVILGLVTYFLSSLIVRAKEYTLDFPNKEVKWFYLSQNNKKVAELGSKHFDFYTNIEKETYRSFIVFSQGRVCKVISTELSQVDYLKLRELQFLRQVLEIPTLAKDNVDFCKGSRQAHFTLKSMKDIKTVKRTIKRFKNKGQIDQFIRESKSKKSIQDLEKEMITYDVIQMKLYSK